MSNMNERDISNNILRNNLNLVINDLFQNLLGYAPSLSTQEHEIPTNQIEGRGQRQNQHQHTFYTGRNNSIFNIVNTMNQSNYMNNYINSYSYRLQNNNNNNNNRTRGSIGRERFNINNILNYTNTENNRNIEERYSNIQPQEENDNSLYFTRNSILNSNIIDNRDIVSLRTIFRIIDIDSSNNDISYNVFERTYTNYEDSININTDVSNSFLNRTLSSLFNTINWVDNYGYNYNTNTSVYSDLSEILTRSLYDKPIYKRKISEQGKETLVYTKYNALNHHTMNTSCPIIQTDFEEGEDVIILPCHHCFNPEAINTWLNEKPECPVCRYELDSEEVKNDEDESENEININNDNTTTRMRNRETYPDYYNFITDLLNESRSTENDNDNDNVNNTNTNTEEELDEDLEMDIILQYLFDASLNRI